MTDVCLHPQAQRWQWRHHWQCCWCNQRFAGKKTQEPRGEQLELSGTADAPKTASGELS